MRQLFVATAVVLCTAACSSTPAAQSAPAVASKPPSPTVAASSGPSPSASPTASASVSAPGSNISISGQARFLPPGPFQITPIKCGTFTAAERQQFGTTAKGGLIFRYTNATNSLTGAPSLTVNFLAGSNVLGSNVNGSPAQIGPGQSAESSVDALNSGGGDLSFTSCELMTYGLMGQASATFAPKP